MSRPNVALRDAALGYASRGIPVLPCTTHSPTGSASSPWAATGSCRAPR
jgi:hypothetical protein